ncbi:MAG TPA: S1/P1 nuclease [Cyclobacteriaceae bacterium]|nr:S1/P1 nuclease [Cyclobacteriaceae bacterium]
MLRAVCITMACMCLTQVLFAWGPTGHRTTGQIADKYLSKKARARIEKILGQETIAMASTWMDEVRSDSLYNFMEDWHWVTIPDDLTYEQSEKNPKGDIIEAIERMIHSLKFETLSPEKESEYLKILIHLVGDIHMPLHVGSRDDRGGNNVKVSWFRTDSNLHRVWDSDMIDDTHLSYTELAASLELPSNEEVKALQKASVLDWASESRSYHRNVYAIGNGKLGYGYSYRNFHIVRKRLLQAGIRLAGLLNEIYG